MNTHRSRCPGAAGRTTGCTTGHFALPLCAALAALLLSACASLPAPTEQMAVSNAALAHAVNAGGPEFAPSEMNLARDKMSRARSALSAKDNGLALSLAEEAQLDAQLAEAKAESAKARKAADVSQQDGQALREEMARKAAPAAAGSPPNSTDRK